MSKTRTELPPALYAVAGAGELAYQQLRKLPEATARTLRTAGENAGHTAEALRERLGNGRDRNLTADLTAELTQVRDSARRGVATLAARAAAAQEQAVTRYRDLIAHGEQVVNDRFGVATGHAEPPAKIEIVVGDVDDEPAGAAAPAATTPAPATKPAATGGTATKPGAANGTATKPGAANGTATKPAAAAGASRSTTGPSTRGVAKTGPKAPGKRASS